MTFKTDVSISNNCIKKYKRSILIWTPISIFGFSFVMLKNYYLDNLLVVWLFLGFFAILTAIRMFYAAKNGLIQINFVIKDLEIASDKIHITTFPIKFGPFINRKSLYFTIGKNTAKFKISVAKYGLEKKATGDVYILSAEANEYLVCENFFSEFQSLKNALQAVAI